jgi:hypothetical protein
MGLPFNRNYDLGRELLKWIAIATMTIDHAGMILYPEYPGLRYVGRLAFPLFAYLLVLGMESTRNVRNYFFRLFYFALISQVPFYFALGLQPWELLNIFFSLSLGVIFIYYLEKGKYLSFLPLMASVLLPVDHGIYGLIMIFCFYILRRNRGTGIFLFFLVVLFYSFYAVRHMTYGYFGILALPIVLLHNDGLFPFNKIGERAGNSILRKYFFYIYYPSHLIMLHFLKIEL